MQKDTALHVAGTIFAIVALVHLLRLFYPFALIVGTYSVPAWINGLAFVVAGTLSALMFRVSKKG